MAGDSGNLDPIHQFEISKIFPMEIMGVDVSFTNSTLFMVIAVVLISGFLILSMRGRALVPGRWQSVAELFYEFVSNLLRNILGAEGMKFFPLVFSLFMFILACNFLGLLPGSFTVTSHVVVTAALAMLVMTIVVGYGFYKNGLGFLKLFVPSGVPLPMLFILVPIEVISFLARPVSLSIRLFANMLAGHITLKVFAGFIISLAGAGGMLSALSVGPLLLGVALTAMEFLVAFLQAFIFATLTCIYLNDAMHPSH